jgi:hypothetical protein
MIDFLTNLFNKAPCPPQNRSEVNQLIEELLRIGRSDDFLSERPGSGFNAQCRHLRTRIIGQRLDELGAMPLMIYVHQRLQRKLGATLASHLEYAWAEIGQWMV